jgi:hypothetical protein
LYSSPSTIRMMKSRKMRWAGHCSAHGGEEASVYDFCGKARRTYNEMILDRMGGRTGLNWLRIGSSGGLLGTR